MVLKPGMEDEAEAIFRKWGLDFAIIGRTTDTLRFVVRHGGEVDGRPADQGARRRGAALRPAAPRQHLPAGARAGERRPRPSRTTEALLRLVGSPDQCVEALGLGAVRPPHPRQHGADAGRRRGDRAHRRRPQGPRADDRRDAALLRGRPGRGRQAGGRGGLAQHHRGRRAAARRHRQPQFRQSGAAGGDGPARRLPSAASARPAGRSTFPVVSGNVSLYNETNGRGILPTPTIGGVGVLRRRAACMPRSPSSARATRSCSSATPRAGSASRSTCARFWAARRARRRRSTSTPRSATAISCASSSARARSTRSHDCSDGGLAVAARRDGDGRRHRRGDHRNARRRCRSMPSCSARIRAAT